MKAPKLLGFPLWLGTKKKRQAAPFLRKMKLFLLYWQGITTILDCSYHILDLADESLEASPEYDKRGYLWNINFFKSGVNCSLRHCCSRLDAERVKELFAGYGISKEPGDIVEDIKEIQVASEAWMRVQGYR